MHACSQRGHRSGSTSGMEPSGTQGRMRCPGRMKTCSGDEGDLVSTLDAEQAYRAVVEFLDQLWERRPVPGDLGDFRWMCLYIPGKGTRDPAMWTDWLAAAKA